MTANQLRKAAITLFGPRGWTSALAACLGVDRSSVHRYIHGQVPIPGPVDAAVSAWVRDYKETGRLPEPMKN